MLKTVLLGFLLRIFPIRCQTHNFGAKVVNGEFGHIDDFSYSAFLKFSCTKHPWTCGASILNQYILLTAAHCLHESTPSCIIVKTGSAHRENGTESLVARYRMHPMYSETSAAYDIGLLMLKIPLIFGNTVGRVALMRSPPYNETGLIAGWGFLDELKKIKSYWLKYTHQIITRGQKCEMTIGTLPLGVFCGGDYYQDSYAAMGDSGSALVIRGYIQVGLVSFKRNEISRSLVIYTDVGYYYNWIISNAILLFCDNI